MVSFVMKKKKIQIPFAMKAIGWAYPKIEKIAPELAYKWAARMFFKPVKFTPPPHEMLERASALRFKLK